MGDSLCYEKAVLLIIKSSVCTLSFLMRFLTELIVALCNEVEYLFLHLSEVISDQCYIWLMLQSFVLG